VNKSVLEPFGSSEVDVMPYIEEAERDEMWSFVESKKQHICKDCGRQFVESYTAKGYTEETKRQCLMM